MEVLVLFALILISGSFSMSEIALITARKTRLQKYIDERDSGAVAAAKPSIGVLASRDVEQAQTSDAAGS